LEVDNVPHNETPGVKGGASGVGFAGGCGGIGGVKVKLAVGFNHLQTCGLELGQGQGGALGTAAGWGIARAHHA
jgi:hypothetical protein